MQVHQVVIRPHDGSVLILYIDRVGERFNLALEMAEIPAAAQVVQQCQDRLPPDAEHPARSQIETEINELEKRLTQCLAVYPEWFGHWSWLSH